MTDISVTPSFAEWGDNSAISPCATLKNGPLELQQGKRLEARSGIAKIRSLRERLRELASNEFLCEESIQVTLEGTLYPCALLSSGWWEKTDKRAAKFYMPAKNDIQQWLFHGFRQWAPSWDFSWNFDNGNIAKQHPILVAQLGENDEADSVPVVIPYEKAQHFIAASNNFAMGYAVSARVRGAFGHRKHFDSKAHKLFRNFGGLLDYCLWLDPENEKHTIVSIPGRPSIYSGYVWKCIMPLSASRPSTDTNLSPEEIKLNDVYFVWDHTNFASPQTVEFNLETLSQKEEAIIAKVEQMKVGKRAWVMLQKSSNLVSGEPALSPEVFYDMFKNRQ